MTTMRRTWSRRPRLTIGQMMAAVIGAALVLAAINPAGGPTVWAHLKAILDTLLILPFALTVLLALTGRSAADRRTLARFLAATPLLILAVLYFHVALLGSLALREVPRNLPIDPGSPLGEFLALALFPLLYFAALAFFLPPRCPHCGERSLEHRPDVVADPAPPAWACDDCGVVCRRESPGEPWQLDFSEQGREPEWVSSFAPKLRALRDELRPAGPRPAEPGPLPDPVPQQEADRVAGGSPSSPSG